MIITLTNSKEAKISKPSIAASSAPCIQTRNALPTTPESEAMKGFTDVFATLPEPEEKAVRTLYDHLSHAGDFFFEGHPLMCGPDFVQIADLRVRLTGKFYSISLCGIVIDALCTIEQVKVKLSLIYALNIQKYWQ